MLGVSRGGLRSRGVTGDGAGPAGPAGSRATRRRQAGGEHPGRSCRAWPGAAPGAGLEPGAGGSDLRDPWDEDDWAAGEMLTPAEIIALEKAEGACDDPGWLAGAGAG